MEIFVVVILIVAALGIVAVVRSQASRKVIGQALPVAPPPRSEPAASEAQRVAATQKQAGIFMKASLMLIDDKTLNEPVPKLGACFYLVGAVDALSQGYKLGTKAFLDAAFGALQDFGVSRDTALDFCERLHEVPQESLGGRALIEGGRTVLNWISGDEQHKNEPPLRLNELVGQWSKLSLDDI